MQQSEELRGAGCHLKVHSKSRFSTSGITEFSPHLSMVLVLSDLQSTCLSQLCL